MSRLFSGTKFDQPKRCEKCGLLPEACRCMALPEKKRMGDRGKQLGALSTGLTLTPDNATPPKDQVARLRVENRKGGREVTVITGLEHPANDLAKLCTELKQAIGIGGSVQGRTVELQGSRVEDVRKQLEQRAYKVRVV